MKRIYLLTPETWDVFGFGFLMASLVGPFYGMPEDISWKYAVFSLINFILGSRK